jgi:putative peptidoglycan lipid II flippase
MSLNVAFSFTFSALFQRWGWMPHGGLALANTLATGLEMVGLILIMRVRLGGLGGALVWPGLIKALFSGVLMSCGIWIWFSLGRNLPNAIFTLCGIFIALVIYGVGLALLKTEELNQLARALQQRLGRNG